MSVKNPEKIQNTFTLFIAKIIQYYYINSIFPV